MCTRCTVSRRHLLGLLSGVASAPLLAPLAACGIQTSGPEPVRWGKENCAFCGMIVDDPRFAAEVRAPEGRKVWKFDDIGCAILFMAKQPWKDDSKTEFWAGDNSTGEWIDGRTAWYISGPKSPMAYNFGAVAARRDGAQSFAQFRDTIEKNGPSSVCEVPRDGS